ncbi:Proprotein convertase subtilisin/kexin type 6, partial [Pteropus alecto]
LQIGSLDDYYHFYHSKTFKRSTRSSRGPHTFLRMDPQVTWLQQQQVRRRVKRQVRSDPQALYFNDPIWSNMWYMHCGDRHSRCRSDMNVQAAWKRGYTGKNVVVTILDDGIERHHPDLAPNYAVTSQDPYASYDVNGNDYDPSPRYDASNENKKLSQREPAGWSSASPVTLPPSPSVLAGGMRGRHGLGSIFVWASGNGGREGDHCSCDGYTNSIYTISVSSTTENGHRPWYLEECASTLATTYSSGAFYERKIVTTDLHQRCTDGHTGTSVSAPMVAGIIALALEANDLCGLQQSVVVSCSSQLTWRDVQHLLVKTSRPAHLKANDWTVNGAGHKVSHLYGFGLVDAEALVVEAQKWTAVPAQHVCVAVADKRTRSIPVVQTLRTTALTTACAERSDQHVGYLEHVVARISISHPRRGDLQIYLISPSGTKTQLLAKRLLDHSNEGFSNWEFMSVHSWGEKAEGVWTLEIQDVPAQVRDPDKQGKLKEWSLVLYGTAEHPHGASGCHGSCSQMLEPSTPELEPPTATPSLSQAEVPEDEGDYAGVCHPECGDKGCDGAGADQCLNCVHFSLGNSKTNSLARGSCIPDCEPGTFFDSELVRCSACHHACRTCVGPSREECIHCAPNFLFQDWRCVPACSEGFFPEDTPGLPHRVCRRVCRVTRLDATSGPPKDTDLKNHGRYKIPVIENLGATLDQFDAIDFSDNEIRKLDGFPLLRRLKTLLVNNNRICRIGEGLDQALPCLTDLILTNNSLVELGDLDPLAALKSLTYLSILRNPVTNKKHYRLYVIYKVPQIRVLDFQKVKLKERQEAEKMFKGKRGAQLAKDIARRTKTFSPGAGLPSDKKKGGPSAGDVEAIKNAIASASTLAEVERLKGLLQSGQIPGRERRPGPADDGEEEMEEDTVTNGS